MANQIEPVAMTLPQKFRMVRKVPSNPLAGLPKLPIIPPEFILGKRYMLERKKSMNMNKNGFLMPEEEKLVHHLIRTHETAFDWTEEEKEKFSEEYFKPVVISTVEHIPWAL